MKVYDVLNDDSLATSLDTIKESEYLISDRRLRFNGVVVKVKFYLHKQHRELHYLTTEDDAPNLDGQYT
jgi:hypothetical protein